MVEKLARRINLAIIERDDYDLVVGMLEKIEAEGASKEVDKVLEELDWRIDSTIGRMVSLMAVKVGDHAECDKQILIDLRERAYARLCEKDDSHRRQYSELSREVRSKPNRHERKRLGK